MSIQRKSTERVELVETHNLALSFRRLQSIQESYNESAARRALYHAVCMVNLLTTPERTALRLALNLP